MSGPAAELSEPEEDQRASSVPGHTAAAAPRESGLPVFPIIEVAGDPTIDWMLVLPPEIESGSLQTTYRWDHRAGVGISGHAGGAALLSNVLTRLVSEGLPVTVRGVELDDDYLRQPNAPEITRVYSSWTLFPRETGSTERAWRLCEFLGQQAAERPPRPALAAEADGAPTCLVIDDSNHGFRDTPAAWPAALCEPARRPGQKSSLK